jgi:predicted nucleic acid-binding protein
MLLLDAGVWIAAARPWEVSHHAAAAILAARRSGDISVAALDLTLYEVANVMTVRARGPEAADSVVKRITTLCGRGLVRADRRLVEIAIALAAEHGLSVYDASYVAVARPRAWTLVSCDRDLLEPGFAVPPDAVELGG